MRPAPAHPLHLALGFTVWSAWLVAAYGGLTVGCVLAPPPPADGPINWINGVLGLLTVLTVAGLLYLAWRCARAAVEGDARPSRFVPAVGAVLHGAAAFSTVFTGLPLAVLAPCV